MIKQKQYFTYKFYSERLSLNNYNIQVEQEKETTRGNVVSLSESQMIRTYQEISGDTNKFIENFVIIEFANVQHYKKIIKNNGFIVNEKRYVRFICGAGHARKSTVIFINEQYKEKMDEILNCGIDFLNFKMVPAKYNAYFALYSSSSIPVTQPYFVVVKDLVFNRDRLVDFIASNNGADVVERNVVKNIEQNAFDGQGLISPSMSYKWASDLDIDYCPSSFLIRAPFIKGQVVTFDFIKLAKELSEKYIEDIWGYKHLIEDVDVILTESQFKASKAFSSQSSFLNSCFENGLKWGVSRVSPKEEKSHFWSSYQYLQILNLSKEKVEELCKDTVDYFKDVISFDRLKSLIYLLGDKPEIESRKDLSLMDNKLVIPIMFSLDKNHVEDVYIRQYIIRTLNKKIRESYTGKIILNGNFQFIIADPFALAEHAFGRKPKGLLKERRYYSRYWNVAGVDKVASGRSPMTWKSELNVLILENSTETSEWYEYLGSGIVVPFNGDDTMKWADADFDGDLVWTTNNEIIINGKSSEVPVYYDKKTAEKSIINFDELWVWDLESFGSKIGYITNVSTSYYCFQSMFEKGSVEENAIEDRLTISRKLQGNQIDKTKGIVIDPIPNWTKWDSKNNNSILVEKRPRFMIYLYDYKMKEARSHMDVFNNYCFATWGFDVDELMKVSKKSVSQLKFIEKYKRYSPVYLDTNSVMDIVYDFMRKEIGEIKDNLKESHFDFSIYQKRSFNISTVKKQKVIELIKAYNQSKRAIYNGLSDYGSLGSIVELFRRKAKMIDADMRYVASLAIEICYKEGKNQEFCWKVFEKEILENLIENTTGRYEIVKESKSGKIHFAGKRYSVERRML